MLRESANFASLHDCETNQLFIVVNIEHNMRHQQGSRTFRAETDVLKSDV